MIVRARNSKPDSATSQFFINTRNDVFLNVKAKTVESYEYCVFGDVLEGKETVDKIGKSRTQALGYFENVSVEPIVIIKVMTLP